MKDLEIIFDKFQKSIENETKSRVIERENKIKLSKPYDLSKKYLPNFKSPQEIFRSPWLFSKEPNLEPVKVVDSDNQLVLGIFPSSNKDYGGRVRIDDLAVLSALIGMLEDLVKKEHFDILHEKIEITAYALLKKMGLKSFSSKVYEELENSLYRLRDTKYRGLLLGKNGWESEFHFLDFLEIKREKYQARLRLKKIIVVVGLRIALAILQGPDKPLLKLGKGFIHLKGGFKKKLWYLIVGRIGRTECWFTEENIMNELECSHMAVFRFREKLRRTLKTLPWKIDDLELKEKSVYKFIHTNNYQLEFKF